MRRFVPSVVSYGAGVSQATAQTTSDVGKVAGAGLGTAATLVTTVPALLTAAGMSATVPVAGWIVAGGLVLASSAIALVGVMRDKKQRNEDLVAKAAALGFTSAAELPSFFSMSTGLSIDKQTELGQKLQKQLTSNSIFDRGFKSPTKIKEQLSVLGAAMAYQQAELLGNAPPLSAAAQQDVQAKAPGALSALGLSGSISSSTAAKVGVGVLGVGGALLLLDALL